MHIDSALRGVPEEERCSGWKTGHCAVGGTVCQHTCPDCGMNVQASTDDYLAEVIVAHKKRPLIGKSQCEKKVAGFI